MIRFRINYDFYEREFIFIEYIKKVVQVDYPDNGLRARSSLSQDKISADELAPIVTLYLRGII